MEKYQEIRTLYLYCASLGFTELKYESWFDGHIIIFPNGADVAQYRHSYGSNEGCVEFSGLCDEYDYTAVPLEEAKRLIELFKDELEKTP